jgi:hypothetical protein
MSEENGVGGGGATGAEETVDEDIEFRLAEFMDQLTDKK